MDKKLVSFIVGGDPSPEYTVKFMEGLSEYSDIIELGIPFSDPMADGETIQKADLRALNSGMTVSKIFEIIKNFKEKRTTPIVVMTYYNPVYQMGVENFIKKLKDCGGDGLIIVDLPVEESEGYVNLCNKYGIKTIFLSAPNTSEERLKLIDKYSNMFVYLVSLYGTTGSRDEISEKAIEFLKRAKKICKNPVYVGFGISKKEHAKKFIENGADGIVVGSAYVKIIEEYGKSEETINKLREKAKELKEGILEGCKNI